jgi:Cu(I)/Ag(I) efflux system membrane fusion protein
MANLSRGRLITVGTAAFVLGVSSALVIVGRQEIRAWMGSADPSMARDGQQKPSAQADAKAGMDYGQSPRSPKSQAPMDHSQHQTETAAPSGTAEGKILYWYDPMHPSYRSDKPGIAPDCGMKLLPMYAGEAEAMKHMPPGTVKLSPEKQQLIGVRYTEVHRGDLIRTIRSVARVEPDDTKIARVHVKIAGWIDKVYLDYVGKLVKKGEPLFSLYSPELVSTEQEYLIARKGEKSLADSSYPEVAAGAQSLLRAARDRLRLWDVSEDQIKHLEDTGEVKRTVTLYSPADGFVVDRNAFEQVYVTPDKDLYEIADLSTVWVYVDIYQFEAAYVTVGQPVSMQLSYYPGKTYNGKVDYIYPTLDRKTWTVKVRLAFPNPDYDLKPGMFADAELKINYGVRILVPSEAVLNSGIRQIVFLARPDGYFEPRQVTIGPRFDDQTVILRGLRPGDRVVASGNFLIDSESQLSSAMEGMAGMSH